NSIFNLNLEYNNAGGILNKIQHHEQDVQVNEHNTYDHQYNYIDGTHKIVSIFNLHTGNMEEFDYDHNGNMTYRNSTITGEEHLYWDEQDRLKAFHHPERDIFQYYTYDDKGERTIKYNMTGAAQLYQNGALVDLGSMGMDIYKVYPNPYMVVPQDGPYTKHYFDGSTRFASRLEGDVSIFHQTTRPQKTGNKTTADPGTDLKLYLEKAGLTDKVEREFAKSSYDEGVYFLHGDHLGTATFVTDHKSNTTQFFLNLPFGEMMAEQQVQGEYENPYKFNAKELDVETELYYYGARYYNPRLSVWYGVDPLAEKMPSWSPYNYAFDNPVRYTDPDGREPKDDFRLNRNGTFTLLKKTNDNFDRVYNSDESKSIEITKGIVQS